MDAKNDTPKLVINIPKYVSADKQPTFAREQAQAEVDALIKAKVAAGEDLPQRVDVEVKSDYLTLNYRFGPPDISGFLRWCSNDDKNP